MRVFPTASSKSVTCLQRKTIIWPKANFIYSLVHFLSTPKPGNRDFALATQGPHYPKNAAFCARQFFTREFTSFRAVTCANYLMMSGWHVVDTMAWMLIKTIILTSGPLFSSNVLIRVSWVVLSLRQHLSTVVPAKKLEFVCPKKVNQTRDKARAFIEWCWTFADFVYNFLFRACFFQNSMSMLFKLFWSLVVTSWNWCNPFGQGAASDVFDTLIGVGMCLSKICILKVALCRVFRCGVWHCIFPFFLVMRTMFAMFSWIQLAEMQLQWAMGAAPEGENPLQLPKKLLAWKLDKHCLQHFDKTYGVFCIEHASLPVQAASCRGGAKECAPRGHKVTRHLSLIPFLIFFVARICPLAFWVEVSCWCRWRIGTSHFGPSGGSCVGLKQFEMSLQ